LKVINYLGCDIIYLNHHVLFLQPLPFQQFQLLYPSYLHVYAKMLVFLVSPFSFSPYRFTSKFTLATFLISQSNLSLVPSCKLQVLQTVTKLSSSNIKSGLLLLGMIWWTCKSSVTNIPN